MIDATAAEIRNNQLEEPLLPTENGSIVEVEEALNTSHTNDPQGESDEENQDTNASRTDERTFAHFSSMGRTYVEPAMRTLFLPQPTAANNTAGDGNYNDEDQDLHDAESLRSNSRPDDVTNGPLLSNSPSQEDEALPPHAVDLLCVLLLAPLFARVFPTFRWEDTNNVEFVRSAIGLVFSCVLLQASYLTWGYEQELIMTTEYNPTDLAPQGRFPSATFCVFVNRCAAFSVAAIVSWFRHGWKRGLLYRQDGGGGAPLRAFSLCAISNTLSSWFAYASLLHVSFPVVTVFRSSRIIPVMILGKVLHGTRYAWDEYAEAIAIALGVAVFSLAQTMRHFGPGPDVLGFLFLLADIVCYALTNQWQEKIYQTYGRCHVDAFQMMMGVNVFAIIFLLSDLVVADEIRIVMDLLRHNPPAIRSLLLAAAASTLGQVCSFHVVREYGPLVFTIIMTVRQMVTILLSAVVFGHDIGLLSIAGALIVFATVARQIRRNYSLARQPELLMTNV